MKGGVTPLKAALGLAYPLLPPPVPMVSQGNPRVSSILGAEAETMEGAPKFWHPTPSGFQATNHGSLFPRTDLPFSSVGGVSFS